MSNQIFQTLKELPIPLCQSQCVLHKHEFLICGGWNTRDCFSYDILKNEYKFILKLVDNNNKSSNEITLLSFGGSSLTKRHTLMMKYVSVWSNISNKLNKSNSCNERIPFTDNDSHPIIIGRDKNHNYLGVRAVIGGSSNHLLFVTYYPNNISVFDLNTFQFIQQNTLQTSHYINYRCFVSNSKKGQKVIKTNQGKNKQNYQMLLFCVKTGLYDDDSNTFKFRQLPVYKDIGSFYAYAYAYINDVVLSFGGRQWIGYKFIYSKLVHKYSIQKKNAFH
ncbi:hypothetical protein RFI_07236 [Reticulomyxa filosa]|uniref:Uncharacterized protein n=1 Tax=Reticulomyxa filosa TaxID=46433 RepID=X6NV74_RETFI|nr:hypothetical protein RFI_07236 [Reticulomyxa filosa]|eukprot:ETO29886.1 hypothetical protein RFI_07236 [Reticulomyxa filosa]